MGATEELGRPPPRESRQEGLGVCEDFLEEEDPHKPQHGGKAVQEIHKQEMSDLD